MPLFSFTSPSAQKTIATALSTAVNSTSAGWNSSQDVNCSVANLIISLPAITGLDFGKTIALRNTGTTSFNVALTGGTLNTAIGLTVNPGSIWTFEAQTLTTANVSATNAAQNVAPDNGTSTLTTSTSLGAGNTTVATALAMPGMTFVPKETAAYLISINIHGNQTVVTTNNLVAILTDNAAPTVAIANSETLISVLGATSAPGENSGSNSFILNATAGSTYQVRGFGGNPTNAAFLSNSNGRSTLTWQKVSGTVPVTGQSVDYYRGNITTFDFATVSANAGITKVGGNLADSGITNTIITLPEGKLFDLRATINVQGGTGSSLRVGWQSLSGTALLTKSDARPQAGNQANNSGMPNAVASASVLTAVPTTVQLTITNSTDTTGISLNTGISDVAVTQIGSTATIAMPPKVTIINASGTFNRDPNSLYAIIEAVGGGGSAGGAPATAASQASGAASGGSGTYLKVLLTATQLGASQSVTIGAGGAGVAGGITGNAGGVTSMGTLFSCPGGAGGGFASAGGSVFAGGSGTAALATVTTGTTINNLQGKASDSCYASFNGIYHFSASGGNPLGNGTSGGLFGAGAASVAGTGYGSGSRGAINQAVASAQPSVAGQSGVIVVVEMFS